MMIFTLLTTLLSLDVPFLSHLASSRLRLYAAIKLGTFGHIMYGPSSVEDVEIQNIISVMDNVSCMCSSATNHHGTTMEAAAESDRLLRDYLSHRNERSNIWRPASAYYSCTLVDYNSELVWLVGDRFGTMPIWYAAFTPQENENRAMEIPGKSDLIITSDLLAAQRLGYTQPLTPLGPGQIVSIDIRSGDIVSIDFAEYSAVDSSFRDNRLFQYPHTYAMSLLSATMGALEDLSIVVVSTLPPEGVERTQIPQLLLELDHTKSSSLLLACAADALGLSRAVRVSQVLANAVSSPTSLQFENITGGIIDPRHRKTVVYAPNFMKIASERWNIIQAAAAMLTSTSEATAAADAATEQGKTDGYRRRIFVPFDDGLDPRPLEVYLQNLFAVAQGVEIVYPLADPVVQEALLRSDFPKSYLYQSIDILRANGACNSSGHGTREYSWQPFSDPCEGRECATFEFEGSNAAVADSEEEEERGGDVEKEEPSKLKSEGAIETEKELGRLWRAARRHADPDNYLVVLLATSGYLDMLSNFMCFALSRNVNCPHMLIITPNEDVAALARSAGVGVYMPTVNRRSKRTTPPEEGQSKNHTSSSSSEEAASSPPLISFADFGSLSYQELMLFRTETVMQLLLLGFRPIIADIDTVWLRNPIEVVKAEAYSSEIEEDNGPTDISVTDDRGEVCGCFVALNHTENAIRFWERVVELHRAIVYPSRGHPGGHLANFSDSEQKVLTDLLMHGRYDGSITVRMLPSTLFPSGFQFFNMHSHLRNGSIPVPAVVHNNFIIGREVKKTRFERYALWATPPPSVDGKSGTSDFGQCTSGSRKQQKEEADTSSAHAGSSTPSDVGQAQENQGEALELDCTYNPLDSWQWCFKNVEKDISLPSVAIMLPIHDSVFHNGRAMIQVISEGIDDDRDRGRLFVENDPPSYVDFRALGVYDVNLSGKHIVLPMTTVIDRSNIEVVVDIGLRRDVFAFDRNGKHHQAANERVLRQQRDHPVVSDVRRLVAPSIDKLSEVVSSEARNSSDESIPLKYTIIVLTYKREKSLQRLLRSLLAADYMGQAIGLKIFVDGNKTDNAAEVDAVREVRRLAESFEWPFGEKSVIVRPENAGLLRQWFYAWRPKSEQEAVFIFEDDLEVSPLFFRWAHAAASKYYTKSQLSLHLDLLESVRTHIRTNGSAVLRATGDSSSGVTFDSPIDEFVSLHAGEPLLYGVCLQKQHLDASHYPRRMHVRNANRPYLYSLIGSWGPLLLPLPWLAFREWWAWRFTGMSEKEMGGATEPMTENIIVNYYYKKNPSIWTPWLVRFAYETGSKCLYSNIPGNVSLVTNFRESGENYETTLGAETETLTRRHAMEAEQAYLDLYGSNSSHQTREEVATGSDEVGREYAYLYEKARLHFALTYLPSMHELAQWQYDYNLRRAGSLGVDELYVINDTSARGERTNASLHAETAPGELDDAPTELSEIKQTFRLRELAASFHRQVSSKVAAASASTLEVDDIADASVAGTAKTKVYSPTTVMTPRHWGAVVDMLQSHLLPFTNVLHLEASALLPLLLPFYNRHTVLSSSPAYNSNSGAAAPLEIAEKAPCSEYSVLEDFPLFKDKSTSGSLECLSFDSTNTSTLTAAGMMTNHSYDLVVIHMAAIRHSGLNVSSVWTTMDLSSIEYVLVLDNCAAAPTDFQVRYKLHRKPLTASLSEEGSSDSNSEETEAYSRTVSVSYTLVEDICAEGAVDAGATLYRLRILEGSLSEWIDNRHALSRRLQGGLITRRIIRRRDF